MFQYIKYQIGKNSFPVAFLMGIGLLFLSVKGTDAAQIDIWFVVISLPIYVVWFKQLAVVFAAVCFLIAFIVEFFSQREIGFSLKGIGVPMIFFVAIILFIVRGLIDADDAEVARWVMAFLFNVFLFYLAVLIMCYRTAIDCWVILREILYVWAIGYLALNIFLYINGYGFTDTSARFYGASAHPNFLGVCMAISFLVVLFSNANSKKFNLNFVHFIFLICIAFFLILSGSRTSWLMVVVGVGGYISIVGRLKFMHAIYLLIISVPLLIYGSEILGLLLGAAGDYDERLVENTRSEAWNELFYSWLDNPIFGAGHLTWASENSLLKSLAFGGLIVGLPIFAINVAYIFQVYLFLKVKNYRGSLFVSNQSYGLAILAALYVGSHFEGYLLELSGVWVIVLTMLLIAVGRSLGFSVAMSR